MDFSSGVTGTPQPQHNFSFKEAIKKAPWMDIALVIGIVALAGIAVLSQTGVIHLPHLGTISAKYVEYALYAGSGALLLIEAGRLLYKCIRSSKNDQPKHQLTMKQMPKEGEIEFKMQVAFLDKEAEAPTYFHAELDESNTTRAMFYGKEAREMPKESMCEFTVASQPIKLTGLYPPGTNTVEAEVEIEEGLEELAEEGKLDAENIQNMLDEITLDDPSLHLTVQIGENAISSPKGYTQPTPVERTTTPSEYTFDINGQKTTLYGIYPSGTNISDMEEDISLALNLAEGTGQESIKAALDDFLKGKDISVAVKIGDQVIVSATHYLYVDSKTVDGQRGTRRTEVYSINEESHDLLILGSPATIQALTQETSIDKTVDLGKKKYPLHQHARQLTEIAQEMGVQEVSLVVLNLGERVQY